MFTFPLKYITVGGPGDYKRIVYVATEHHVNPVDAECPKEYTDLLLCRKKSCDKEFQAYMKCKRWTRSDFKQAQIEK